jgi:hypothetical protein
VIPFSAIRVWFVSLLFWIVASSGHATELLGPPEITAISPTAVTVHWRTDVPTGTKFYYGLNPDQLSNRADGALSDVHEVTVQNLQPGATYYFAVATARKRIGTGTFTTSSSVVGAKAPVNVSPATKRSIASVSAPASPVATPTPATPAPSRFSILNLFRRPTPTPPPPQAQAPPARVTWGHPSSLPDHFARHGGDFGARDPEDYARMAWEFGQRAQAEHLPTKIDAAGVRRVFDPNTGAFAAYNPDGTTKTFFKPGSRGYFDRQPGRLIP